uniref:Wound-responsive family protein n=1 Tax=Fagus sylvatica TaxID=28930 RepID=A0A2N9G263_FAGSY
MSSTSRAWTVAASLGAVEAMKDQGIFRWGHVLRSLQQHSKNNVRSYSQAKNLSPQSSSAISKKIKSENMKQSEESLRKVMYLSCWDPN